MNRIPRKTRTAMLAVVVTGLLLGSGTCVSRDLGRSIATSTTNQVATLLIDSFLIDPLQQALDKRNADQ